MKKLHIISLLFIIFLVSLMAHDVSASVCEAGDPSIADIYDSTLGWIDSQPPNQECIRGIYTNGTGGTETCTADAQCDGKNTNTYICNDAVGVAYCGYSCEYTALAQTCQIDCNADAICDDKLPGEEFADPSGDGTINYCGGGFMNYSCTNIDTNICESDYGADALCDGIQKGVQLDLDGDTDLDVCNATCEYNDCAGGNDSMCLESQACLVNICQLPLNYNVPEFNGFGLSFALLTSVIGILVIKRKLSA